jgi:hypothetical protein
VATRIWAVKVFEISSLRGHSCLSTGHRKYNGRKQRTMSPSKRYAKKQAKARPRRRLQAHERLERDRCQAQRAAEALHQALAARGLPDHLVVEIAGRIRSPQQLRGTIVGVRFPPLFGGRTPSELWRGRGWDKQWPARMLGALPQRSGLKRLRRLGLEVLVPLWRYVATKVRPRRAAGSGLGRSMTRCSTRMGHRWASSDAGGVGSNIVGSRVLMGSCWW